MTSCALVSMLFYFGRDPRADMYKKINAKIYKLPATVRGVVQGEESTRNKQTSQRTNTGMSFTFKQRYWQKTIETRK